MRLVKDNKVAVTRPLVFLGCLHSPYRMRQEHFAEHDITLEVISTSGWVNNIGLLLGRDCMKGYM